MVYDGDVVARALGLVKADYFFLMGLSGLLMGAFLCFFVLSAISNISKGH